MKNRSSLLVLAFSLSLAACGGGGGGGSSSPSVTASANSTELTLEREVLEPALETVVNTDVIELIIAVDPDPDAVYDSTAELIVPSSFTFEQEYALEVNISNVDNRKAYISICSDFSEEGDDLIVNYNSCLLRTSIKGAFRHQLLVPNNTLALVMAIWYLDEPQSPRFEKWHKSEGEIFVVHD